jgi:tetratricopeptide (TPR) repeat protein
LLTPEPGRFGAPGTFTPKHLAEKILTSKTALEGERKQIIIKPISLATLATALAYLGEPREAMERVLECLPVVERLQLDQIRPTPNVGASYHWLGRACLLLDRLDEARRLSDRAIELSPPRSGHEADTQHLLGDIATHPDWFDAESGEAHYRKALTLAEPRGMRPLIAHCHLGLGKLYRRTGKRQEAQEHLTTATTMYREMDMRFWLEQAEAQAN